MNSLNQLTSNLDEAEYSFHNEIMEILTPVDNKICGYDCTPEMVDFMGRHGEAIIAFAKRCKKKDDEMKINEKQGRLF